MLDGVLNYDTQLTNSFSTCCDLVIRLALLTAFIVLSLTSGNRLELQSNKNHEF